LRIAENVEDLTVAWRACAVVASASRAPGDVEAADDARRRGSEIVRAMALSLGDEELGSSFLARPDAAALLEAADP
jgi:hypothetical protein